MSRRVILTTLVLCVVLSLACVIVVSAESGVPRSRGGLGHVLQPSKLQHQVSQRVHAVQGQARVGSKLGEYYHSTRQLYDEIKVIGSTCKHMTIGWERAPGSVDNGQQKSLMTVRLNYLPETYPKKSERALFFFGEHARELISPEVGLEFLRRACDPNMLATRFLHVDATLEDILKTTEFLIFPNANPGGRRITERGAYCNRVSDKRVDLNRNWGEHWSSKSSHPDTYPGTKAWSEPETVILAHAASTFLPTIFISIHSGSLHMLSPFAFKSSLAGEPAASTSAIDPPNVSVKRVGKDSLEGTGLKPVLALLKHVNRDFCRCEVGAAGHLLGYLSPGTCLDYIYNRVGTRYAFALEIYSGKRYAGPKQHNRGASALLQEEMTQTTLTETEDELGMDEALDTSDLEDSEMMELKSVEQMDLESHESLAQLPSYDLPSFTEMDSKSQASGELQNDGDIPEQRAILFPRTQRGKPRSCLTGFNPVTHGMYKRTVDHWSRGLLAFVHSIHATRPKATEAVVEADE